MSAVGVLNISPAVSVRLLPSLSLGAALNLSYGFLELKRPQMILDPKNRQPIWGQYSENSGGWGIGATFGLLFKPINLISVGASIRTANNIAFEGTAENGLLKAMLGENYKDADLERDIKWPVWYGAGLALHPLGFLTITADVQFTNWGTLDTISTTYTGWEAAGVTEGKMNMSWEDKMQFRLGAEVDLFDFLAVRAGYYTDPAPAPDETLNILFPSIDYNGITFGLAFEFAHLTIEGSAEYLMGSERTVNTQTLDNMAGTHNMNIFAFFVGAVFEF
jgi:long-chain fatty acid transport protein